MIAADLTRIAAIHEAANERLPPGQRWVLPPLASPLTVCAWVIERDGEVAGAAVCRATTEAFFVADSPDVIIAATREIGQIDRDLVAAGVEDVHAWVPRRYVRAMQNPLRRLGFVAYNPDYQAFYKEVPSG